MADENVIDFLSRLELMLQVSGVEDTAAAFDTILKKHSKLIKNAKELKKTYGSLDKASKAFIKEYKSGMKGASKATDEQRKSVGKLSKSYRNLSYSINRLRYSSFVNLMTQGVKVTLQYQQSLLKTAASVRRLGIGIGELRGSLEKISDITSLTRMETSKLFGQYEAKARFISLEQFENMMKRIEKVVGPNVESMGEMLSVIVGLSDEYPKFAKALAGMTDADMPSLGSFTRQFMMAQGVGQEQYKVIQAYISGVSQVSEANRKIQEQYIDQNRSLKEFKKAWEDISVIIGEKTLRPLQGVSLVLKDIKKWKKEQSKPSPPPQSTGQKVFGGISNVIDKATYVLPIKLLWKALELRTKLEKIEEMRAKKANVEATKGAANANKNLNNEIDKKEFTSLLDAKKIDVAKAYDVIVKSQLSSIEAMAEKMSIMGETDFLPIMKMAGPGMEAIKLSIQYFKEYKKLLKTDLSEVPIDSLAALKIRKQIVDVEAQINSELRLQQKFLETMIKPMKHMLGLTSATAQKMGLLVQLADNFAIGVGASAQMRIEAYEAEGEHIKMLEKKLSAERAAYNISLSMGVDNIAQKEKVLGIENEILQSQIKQAGMVKALRDGWISAMTAMNTGFGSFTEIIMNAEQGLAQMQRQSGSVRASLTGAMARPGEIVGYNRSERFGQRPGQIVGRDPSNRFRPAYGGRVGAGRFDIRKFELRSRGAASISLAGRSVASGGGPEALASPYNRSAYAANAGSVYNIYMNGKRSITVGSPGEAVDQYGRELASLLNRYGSGSRHGP